MQSQPHEFFLRLLKKEKIAANTYSFFFDQLNHHFNFSPGQYVKTFLDFQIESGQTNNRSFTICSAPLQKEILMITIKIDEKSSSFKQKMNSVKVGEKVRFFGPMGMFILPQESERPLVFLAGGIGITPFHSMLLQASATHYQRSITLFVSFKSEKEMLFFDELTEIAKNHPTINVVYTTTRQSSFQQGSARPESIGEIDPGVTSFPRMTNKRAGETGRISEQLLKKYVTNPSDADYMICGPTEMVVSMLDMLDDMKISLQQIKEEVFTGY